MTIANSAGYTAYIDESGCDGFKFDEGSTNWLVLAAVVSRTANLAQYQAALNSARVALRKADKERWRFKTYKETNSDAVKWAVVDAFSKTRCQAVAVAVFKPGLVRQGWAENPGDLYFHASKFLVERLSFACRDADRKRAEPNRTCQVIFSKRGGLRYDRFQGYMRRLRAEAAHGSKTDWRFIDPEAVSDEPHSDWNAAHLAADYLASSFGWAFNRRDQGVFEPRFARLWRDRVYSYGGRYVGNGLKVWPDEGLDELRADPIGDLIRAGFNWR